MKAKNLIPVKSKYSFVAPVISAAIRKGSSEVGSKYSLVDLNNLLAPKPHTSFMVRVSGESMKDEGIFEGDILIVDKSELPSEGKVVIAALNGELLVKTYREIEGKVYLFSANQKFLPIEIFPYSELSIQGVVKHVIHSL